MKRVLLVLFLWTISFSSSYTMNGALADNAPSAGIYGYQYQDFENYDEGELILNGTTSADGVFAGTTPITNQISHTVTRDGDNSYLTMFVSATCSNKQSYFKMLNTLPNELSDSNDLDYYVISYDLRNGHDSNTAFSYLQQQRVLRNYVTAGASRLMTTTGNILVSLDEGFNSYMLIGDKKAGKLKVVVNGIIVAEVDSSYVDSVEHFYGLQLTDYYSSGNDRYYDIDNMAIYGVKSSELANRIVFAQDKEKEHSVRVDILYPHNDAIFEINGKIVQTTTGENGEYVIDDDELLYYPLSVKVNDIYGQVQSSYQIPVKANLDSELKISKVINDNRTQIENLEYGINEFEFTAINITPKPLTSACVMFTLKNGNTIKQCVAKNISILDNSATTVKACFDIVDLNDTVSITIKNNINGSLYYSDTYAIDANGVSKERQQDIEEEYPLIDDKASSKISFYSFVLGSIGKYEPIDGICTGLIDCVINVNASEGLSYIAVLKKNGAIESLSSFVEEEDAGETCIHAIINVPEGEGYSIEVYPWFDLMGKGSYFGHAEL